MPSGIGSAAHTSSAPVRLPASDERAEVLHGAEEVRLLHEDRCGVVVHRGGERLQISRTVVVERHLHDLDAVAGRIGRERSRECGCRPRLADAAGARLVSSLAR